MVDFEERWGWGLAVLLTLVLGGCQTVSLADDIDLDFDWAPLEGRGNALHTPYVLGTEVTIWAYDNLDNSNDEETWTLSSSDETVLRIASTSEGSAQCLAVGPGTAEVRVHDEDGSVIARAEIEVRAPTRAELFAHGPLLIGWSSDEALVQGPIKILQDGTGTFLVRYYDGEQRLYGNGVLDARAEGEPAEIELEERQSYLFENREWLSITAHAPGTHEVDLYVWDELVGQGVVETVTAEEVSEIALLAQDDRWAEDEDWLAVLAQAYDDRGDPIYGVEYEWALDGLSESGMGDLYRYAFDGDADVELTASFRGLSDGVSIHASDGYVTSTNNIGCSIAGAGAGVAGRDGERGLRGLLMDIFF